jgi:hypothetical protein
VTSLRPHLRVLAVVVLCLAPVPGDIGSCGQPATPLDATRFFGAKKVLDCTRCQECGLEGSRCDEACDRSQAPPTAFPSECFPVVHDGEVCLRRLLAAPCDDYASYVAEISPVVPSECNFCPVGGP